jgi:hypothetical protein
MNMTKVFSLGQTFVVNGTEWIGREYRLDAAFEGWTVVAVNGSNQEAKFSLAEVEKALGV